MQNKQKTGFLNLTGSTNVSEHVRFHYTPSPRADHSNPYRRDNQSHFTYLSIVLSANICCSPKAMLGMLGLCKKAQVFLLLSESLLLHLRGVYTWKQQSKISGYKLQRKFPREENTQLLAYSTSWDDSQLATWKSPLPTFRMSRINRRNNVYQVLLGSAPNSLTVT